METVPAERALGRNLRDPFILSHASDVLIVEHREGKEFVRPNRTYSSGTVHRFKNAHIVGERCRRTTMYGVKFEACKISLPQAEEVLFDKCRFVNCHLELGGKLLLSRCTFIDSEI